MNRHALSFKKRIRKKSICFISETGRAERPLLDPSVRYRCYHPAEQLLHNGYFCSVYSAKQFYANPCFEFDVYVFHRPNMERQNFSDIIHLLRKQGKTLIADYDDLIFGTEEIALASSAVKNATLTPEKAIAAFSSSLTALIEFDQITTSTASLAEQVKKFNPAAKVEVLPNIVPNSVLTVHEQLGTPFVSRSTNTIGYFAGTKSHDKDFPIISEVLHRVLSENPEFSLLVVGPVTLPSGLSSLPNVTVAPVVNYWRLPGLMTMCSTVVAPLENTLFNSCKSRVKFLEAALSGCRLIATPIPDMQAIGNNHLTLAATKDEWYESLSLEINAVDRLAIAKRNFDFIRHKNGIAGLKFFGDLK